MHQFERDRAVPGPVHDEAPDPEDDREEREHHEHGPAGGLQLRDEQRRGGGEADGQRTADAKPGTQALVAAEQADPPAPGDQCPDGDADGKGGSHPPMYDISTGTARRAVFDDLISE